VAILLGSAAPTVSIERPTAVFIETHLEDQISVMDYWLAAVSFNQIGYTAHLLGPSVGVGRVYAENLTDFVSALLITPRDSVSFSLDIEMLDEFVAAGNGLVITGQSSTSSFQGWAREAVNELTSRFGIEFEQDLVCDPDSPYLSDPRYPHWPMITNFDEGEIAEGVERISYISGSSLSLSGNATPLAWTSENAWSDLDGDLKKGDGESSGQKVIAAASTHGKGRVVALGDNDLWASRFLEGLDNNKFLLNILKWVSSGVEESEVKIMALDVEPPVAAGGDGNYTASVPVRIWNQGTAAAKNLTIYVYNSEAELVEGNLTRETVGAGEMIEVELSLRFSLSGTKFVILAYEYFTPDEEEFNTMRTITLSSDYDLYHLDTLLWNGTEIAFPDAGGLGNLTAGEIEVWANTTRDLAADLVPEPQIFNHTNLSSKAGTAYRIETDHISEDIIGFGDPGSNYFVGHVAQQGDLRVLNNRTPPKLPANYLLDGAVGTEEVRTLVPRLEGDLSEWGYLSLVSEMEFVERPNTRLAAGGFGRRGLEAAMHLLWGILKGDVSEYEAELSRTVALFRGVRNDQGELIGIEFY
jgi:hypothetical protein